MGFTRVAPRAKMPRQKEKCIRKKTKTTKDPLNLNFCVRYIPLWGKKEKNGIQQKLTRERERERERIREKAFGKVIGRGVKVHANWPWID